MGKNKQTHIVAYRLLSVLLSGCIVFSPFDTLASTWNPTVLVNTESFRIIDDGDGSTDIELRFGGILNEILEFDRTNSRFHFTDDLLVDGNLSASGTVFLRGTLTGALVFHGPFTSDCDDATASKLLWDSATGKFSCGTDQSDPYITRVNSGTGAAGEFITWQTLAENSATCTAANLCGTVMTTTNVGVGTWLFKYMLLYQTASTKTGISFGVNHSGTVGTFNAIRTHISTGTSATSGAGDSDAGETQLPEGYADNDEDAIIGVASLGVDTANTTVTAIVEGIITVTAAGTGKLELKMGSEVAGSAVKIMANSALELMKIK